MNEEVVCGRCKVQGRVVETGQVVMTDRPMEFIRQYPVNGVNTWHYHCMGCNGKVYLQQVVDPRTGRVMADPRTGRPRYQQVRLTGSPDEFKPNSVKPHEQLQIEAAYTIGGAPATKRVPVDPIPAPQPAYTLDPSQQGRSLHPNHPMHPANIRRRMLGRQ
jgi:hypothetical protein